MDSSEFPELIPGLPEELALECLTRLHYSAHSVSSHVCRRWRELLQSKEFYYHRRQSGYTHKAACLIQALPVPSDSKPVGQPSYGISLFDPVSGTWDRVAPISRYPNGSPLFCQIASTEGKLIVMGGWDPATWDPIKDVFMYEFTTRKWTQCEDMPSKRSFFAVGAAGGRVFVAGGHDENKNALNTAWVFDTRKNEWAELARMLEERDECEGVVVGESEFWVVSGYGTDTQGRFKSSAESLQLETGEWRRVENAWRSSQSPRGCIAVDKNGNLRSWAESDPDVRVGSCGIDLGECSLVTGSAYQGAPHGFFFFMEGQNRKLVKADIPDDFAGIVQSGCCVEI